jgi:curved DNA-binding protein CbpA
MNFYQILGVTAAATPAQIKAAYRELAVAHHPDRGGSHDRMVELNIAYERAMAVAKVPQQRRRTQNARESLERPTNIADWMSLYKRLLTLGARRGYKRGWITYKLEELQPPYEIWQLHGRTMGYKEAFATIRYQQQQEASA